MSIASFIILGSFSFCYFADYYATMPAPGEKNILGSAESLSESGLEAPIKDVIIIGGGVSGLAALRKLLRGGVKNVALLEAQDYLGGRVKTLRKDGVTIEEGAHWIHGGKRNIIYNIAKELFAILTDLPDYEYMIRRSDGSSREVDEEIIDKSEALYTESLTNGKLKPFYNGGYGDFFKNRLENDPLFKSSNKELQKSWLHFAEMVVNANEGTPDWNNISAIDADNFVSYGKDHVWKNGFDTLIKHLKKDVPQGIMHLNTAVKTIYWDKPELSGNVEILTHDGRKFLTKRVLLTISVGCIKTYMDELFQPSLPNHLNSAFEHIYLGNPNKVFIHWDSPWWGSTKNLELYLLRTTWNDLPSEMKWVEGIVMFYGIEHSDSTLVAFVTGDYSLQMEDLSENKVKEHLMELIRRIFNDITVPEPIFVKRTQWNKNPWTLGSYESYISIEGANAGIHTRSVYKEPIKNSANKQVLFWGGEHTSTIRYGTVDGAYESGIREANRIKKLIKT